MNRCEQAAGVTMPGRASDEVLAFVQACQVAIGGLAEADLAGRLGTLWACFDRFPRKSADEAALVMGVTAAAKVAAGFFAHFNGRGARPVAFRRPSRHHVNELLRRMVSDFGKANLTISGIAQSMSLTQPYLSRILHLETKATFAVHLNGVRRLAAINELRATDMPVSQVASKAGYRSSGELDRQFRRTLGLTPRRFRALVRCEEAAHVCGTGRPSHDLQF